MSKLFRVLWALVVVGLCAKLASSEYFEKREKEDCFLPKIVGPCRAMIPAYYYNKNVGRCMFFTYGGCQGNANNFDTEEECQEFCGSKSSPWNRI
jgi:hypothetical protein